MSTVIRSVPKSPNITLILKITVIDVKMHGRLRLGRQLSSTIRSVDEKVAETTLKVNDA